MKICIISDIHCKSEKSSESDNETLFYSSMPDSPVNQNPVTSFLKIVDNGEVTSDILICLGDLGDKADKQGIVNGWNAVERIRSKMKISVKIGIPGNHDIDSRKKYDTDPFKFIQNFSLDFPTDNENLNLSFWQKGFCFYESSEIGILMINSVQHHKDASCAEESRLEKGTIESIENELEKIKKEGRPFICILHHHPIKHSNIHNYKDSDSLDNGDELLKLLTKYNFNLIIHGHKHQPRITEVNGLPIFAVGSFSSFANLQGTGINTMFHVVELHKNDNKGEITSWEFYVNSGWKKGYNTNFPAKVGFGKQTDISQTAKDLNNFFLKEKKPLLYDDVLLEHPELNYLIPDKLIQLGKILKEEYGLFVEPEYPLTPIKLSSKS